MSEGRPNGTGVETVQRRSHPSQASVPGRDAPEISACEQNVTIHDIPPEARRRGPSDPDPENPDDLTRIRRINKVLAEKLNRIGITHYCQIAEWSATDVRSLSAALDLGGSIYQQNWIEQAAQLVLRQRKASEALAATAMPAPENVGDSGSPSPSPVPVAEEESKPQPALLIAEPAPSISEVAHETAKPDVFEEPPAASASTAVPPPEPRPPDDLRLICNLPEHVAERLGALGVTRFEQIAAFDADDVATLSVDCALGERINREGWLEQAAALASGRLTKAAKRRLSGAALCIVPYPAPLLESDSALLAELAASAASEQQLAAPEPASTLAPETEIAIEAGGSDEAPASLPTAPTDPGIEETDCSKVDDEVLVEPVLEEAEVTISARFVPTAEDVRAAIDHNEKGDSSATREESGPATDVAGSQLVSAAEGGKSDAVEVAGYQGRIEEAAVEIVAARPARTAARKGMSKTVAAREETAGDDATPIGRFLKALRGR